MEDWEDAAFNHRRLPHGRSKKGGKASGRKGAGTFDPRQALGVYELSSNAVDRLLATANDDKGFLEVHELTDTPGGLVGTIVIGDKMKAVVLLAGSRKVLSAVVEEAEAAGAEHASGEDDDEDSQTEPDNEDDGDDAGTALEEQDRKHNERIQAFEKNSFRSPKFWLQWQGDATSEDGSAVRERNQGYLVFSGNDCRDFQGTLSCRSFRWKDVSMHGRKTTSKARSAPYEWSQFAIEEPKSDEKQQRTPDAGE